MRGKSDGLPFEHVFSIDRVQFRGSLTQMFVVSEKKPRDHWPPSRPTPECFTPPNGVAQVPMQPCVDPDNSGVDGLRRSAFANFDCLCCPDRASQSVFRSVRHFGRFSLRRLKRVNGHHWAKNLLGGAPRQSGSVRRRPSERGRPPRGSGPNAAQSSRECRP